eukprot:CFRG3351T1
MDVQRRISYGHSHDLHINVRLTVGVLEGLNTEVDYKTLLDDPYLRYQHMHLSDKVDLFVTCSIVSGGKDLSAPMRTARRINSKDWRWDELLELPFQYSSLPRNASLTFTVWEIKRPGVVGPIGNAYVTLFSKTGSLRKGRQRLKLWMTGTSPDPLQMAYETDGVSERIHAMEKRLKKLERGDIMSIDWLDAMTINEVQKTIAEEKPNLGPMLYIDLPQFDYPVVFLENITELAPAPSTLSGIHDPEIDFDNLLETKHRLLTRAYRRGHLGQDLKPNAQIRNILIKILRSPPTKALTVREKDLIWKFRFYLTRDKRALTFFLKCVDWTDDGEVIQATELLQRWERINIDDALELLSNTFANEVVRAYGVGVLEMADDSRLELYLLQLVQALKHENWDLDEISGTRTSELASFLIARSVQNFNLGNRFYWYLTVEMNDSNPADYGHTLMYQSVRTAFITELEKVPGKISMTEQIQRQEDLVSKIQTIGQEMIKGKDSRPKKIERLRQILGVHDGLDDFPSMPLPLDPDIMVCGIRPEKAYMFKSALMPLRLTFKTEKGIGADYTVIFKTGDDLRQDQLILQMITLMDSLLQQEQLNLRLIPYKALALGPEHGMVQYIDSVSVAAVLDGEGSVQSFFRKHNADQNAPYGIKAEVMDTYIRSCAGYCVISYILGIGDRHLDNLMLRTDGHLFHIDFGYILGRDPKPFAPPMKLTKEMLEGMGGATSAEYKKFSSNCYNAFLILRRSANLILNLFNLMTTANIPDIAAEPDKCVAKIEEQFRLDLDEEDAVAYLQTVINDSVGALFPQMVEQIHKYMQYWRK